MCASTIVEASAGVEGQEAIYCEGESCQAWYHRWCVGVTKEKFALLAAAPDVPFFCPGCVMNQQRCEISALQEAVKAITAQLSEMQRQQQPERCSNGKLSQQQPWTEVVRKRKKPASSDGRSAPAGASKPSQRSDREEQSNEGSGAESQNAAKSEGRNKHSYKRVAIDGARRIWGTVRATTAMAVKATLHRLTTVPNNAMAVKRKYKTARENSKSVTRWWFVVRGSEEVLQALHAEWPKVAAQTAWKLEPLFSYDGARGEPVNPQSPSKQPDRQAPTSPPQQPSTIGQSGFNQSGIVAGQQLPTDSTVDDHHVNDTSSASDHFLANN